MDTTTMQFIDYDYWHYLKHLLISRESEHPLPDNEVALLRGVITLDEAFFLGVLS